MCYSLLSARDTAARSTVAACLVLADSRVQIHMTVIRARCTTVATCRNLVSPWASASTPRKRSNKPWICTRNGDTIRHDQVVGQTCWAPTSCSRRQHGSSVRTVSTRRSAKQFARRHRGGILTTSIPASANTASNAPRTVPLDHGRGTGTGRRDRRDPSPGCGPAASCRVRRDERSRPGCVGNGRRPRSRTGRSAAVASPPST
jgi:hypothetical protein